MNVRERLILMLLPRSRRDRDWLIEVLLPAEHQERLDFAATLIGYEDFEQMTDHIRRSKNEPKSTR